MGTITGNPLKATPVGNSGKNPEEILGGTLVKIPGITTLETSDKSREKHREESRKSIQEK